MVTRDFYQTMERMLGGSGTLVYAVNKGYARPALRTKTSPNGFVQSHGLVNGWAMLTVVAAKSLPGDLVTDVRTYEAALGPHEQEIRFSKTGTGLWLVEHTGKPSWDYGEPFAYHPSLTGATFKDVHSLHAQRLREQYRLPEHLLSR